jgi:hypothetical protein
MSHELRTPLNAVSGQVDFIVSDYGLFLPQFKPFGDNGAQSLRQLAEIWIGVKQAGRSPRCGQCLGSCSVATGTVPLDGLFPPGFRPLAFVDQEGPKSGTAFTLENVRWHSIPS